MSMPPELMQQMLTQQLQQGGGSRTNPLQAGSQLMQKLMLMRALQQPRIQQQQANNMLPKTNATINSQMPQINSQLQEGVNQSMMANPQMQAAQQPLTPQQMQMMDPSLQPIPGYS